MAPTHAIYHAFLRPAIIQILQASGFGGARPSAVDALTDLAAAYIQQLSQSTARHAAERYGGITQGIAVATVNDVRMALGDMGAFLPEHVPEEEGGRLVWPPSPPSSPQSPPSLPPLPPLPPSSPESARDAQESGMTRDEDDQSNLRSGQISTGEHAAHPDGEGKDASRAVDDGEPAGSRAIDN